MDHRTAPSRYNGLYTIDAAEPFVNRFPHCTNESGAAARHLTLGFNLHDSARIPISTAGTYAPPPTHYCIIRGDIISASLRGPAAGGVAENPACLLSVVLIKQYIIRNTNEFANTAVNMEVAYKESTEQHRIYAKRPCYLVLATREFLA